MTDHLRAAGYFRVSNANQAGELHVSLPVQQEKFAHQCVRKGYVPSGEYTDVESGRKDSRREYQRLLVAARSKEIDVIVVQRLDRFGRNPREILRRVWELQDLGVSVEATDEDLTQEIAMMLHAFMAGEESKRISARVIPTMERASREGRWVAREPYGYTLDRNPMSPRRGKLTIDEDQAAVVRRVYALYLAGQHGWAGIAAILNREGVPSSMGGIWWACAIMDLLSIPTYVGRPVWRGVPIPGGCPAIVSEETWERVRAIQRGRKIAWTRQPPNTAYLLAGLVRCVCGRMRVCHSPDSRHPSYRYYACTTAIASGTCDLKRIQAERLEKAVLEQIRNWELRLPETIERDEGDTERRQRATDRTRIRGRIERIARRREAAYDQLMDKTITKEAYRAGESRYLAELAEAEQEFTALRDVPIVSDPVAMVAELATLRRNLDALEPSEVRASLALLISHVQILSQTTWRVVPQPQIAALLSEPATS